MTFYENHKANLEQLTTRFPKQFANEENIGFSWPDGWHSLVSGVCEQIDAKALEVQWTQIKEKFAGLRMYYADGPLYMDNVATMTTAVRTDGSNPSAPVAQPIIDKAAELSQITCMGCGNPGSRMIRMRVVYTACESCFERHGR